MKQSAYLIQQQEARRRLAQAAERRRTTGRKSWIGSCWIC